MYLLQEFHINIGKHNNIKMSLSSNVNCLGWDLDRHQIELLFDSGSHFIFTLHKTVTGWRQCRCLPAFQCRDSGGLLLIFWERWQLIYTVTHSEGPGPRGWGSRPLTSRRPSTQSWSPVWVGPVLMTSSALEMITRSSDGTSSAPRLSRCHVQSYDCQTWSDFLLRFPNFRLTFSPLTCIFCPGGGFTDKLDFRTESAFYPSL